MNATLHIKVGEKNERSFLKEIYFTTPFKIMNITEDKAAHCLHLMLMSASPGILDGDRYEHRIEVENNCALQLHTQAYQRIYNMKQGASQQLQVHIGINASFCYLPHPSVPHEASVFTGINDFYLERNSRLVFGEVLTCGRKLNGELFRMSKYHSLTNIYFNNKLVIKENLLMQPSFINVHSIGQLEGYTHQASMLFLQDKVDMNSLQAHLLDLLADEKDMESGITKAPVNGLIIRLLGNGAEQLYDCMQRIYRLLPTHQNTPYVS